MVLIEAITALGERAKLSERARHWAADALLGALVASCALTVAQAALPDHKAPLVSAADRTAPVAAAVTPSVQPMLIAFREPVPGQEVASPFGLRQMPWEASGRLHAGVDIAAPMGAPVLAAADGVVVRAGDSPTYGRFAEIKHAEGLTTLYAHMSAIDRGVRAGRALKAGMAVGEVGSSGTSTGPHLHFEIRDARDRPMNPEAFIGRSFARVGDLPLRAALRTPNGVRMAQVSRIPASKQRLMQARYVRNAPYWTAADLARDAASDEPELTGVKPRPIFAPMPVQGSGQGAPPATANGAPVSIGADGRPKATLQL